LNESGKIKWKFLYIVPLKQGLKQKYKKEGSYGKEVFIHSSIKTRIETRRVHSHYFRREAFLYIVPLKQGLKLNSETISIIFKVCFYT